MPKSENINEKLMVLRDFLCQHTTPETKVSMQEILEHLESKDIFSERKSIAMDFERLEKYGINVVYDASNGKRGYYVMNPLFDYDDLRFMVDGIQSLKFIPQKRAEKITNKIRSLTCPALQGGLERTTLVSNRARNINGSAIAGADRIHRAIAEDKQIAFKYAHFTPDRNKQTKYSKNGEKYIVSPYALLWDKGNYYLYAYDSSKERFRTFRVDRMESISDPLLEAREEKELFSKEDLENRKAKVFDMYRGEAHNVKLRCLNAIGDAIIDQFGKDVMFYADGDNHFIVNDYVELSPPFFAWVATFGKKIKILEDSEAVLQMRKFAENIFEMNCR